MRFKSLYKICKVEKPYIWITVNTKFLACTYSVLSGILEPRRFLYKLKQLPCHYSLDTPREFHDFMTL